jgi:hypothetical protein
MGGGVLALPLRAWSSVLCEEGIADIGLSKTLIERISKRVSVVFIGPWIADIHSHHQSLDRMRVASFTVWR